MTNPTPGAGGRRSDPGGRDGPDPRFRDQLAKALTGWPVGYDANNIVYNEARDIADVLMPTIAAEVEARVQAAAHQRAEEANALRHNLRELCDSASDGYVPIAWLRELGEL